MNVKNQDNLTLLMSERKEILKSNLKNWFNKSGFKQEEFAEKLNIKVRTLRSYLNLQSTPSIFFLQDFAKLCNTSVDALLGDTTDYKKATTEIVDILKSNGII